MNGALVNALLADLLTASVAVVTDPPDRRFVAHGTFAHDCECVAVRLADATVEPVPNVACATYDVITLEATVLRCYPNADEHGEAPSAADLTVASQQVSADAGDLVGGLLDMWGEGTLFPNRPEIGCGNVTFVGSRAIGPEGGLAGWAVSVVVRP